MALQPGQMLAHYRLVEKVGEGGMGVVWKALDTVLQRAVALKVLPEAMAQDAERVRRLEAEARAVAAVSHPGIVTLYAIEQAQGLRFLTMEFVEGRTLGEAIPSGGLAPAEFLEIAQGLVEALAAAHHAGIVHRDLKPRNVIVTPEGRVKVLDFGLASPRPAPAGAEGSDVATRTRDPQALAGTIGYMSPEQVQGLPVDARSDVFSLGVVLYEMATGLHPFAAGSAAAVVASLLRDQPVPPTRRNREFPEALDRLVARCLDKDAGRRLRSAEELLWEIEQLRAEVRAGRAGALSIAVVPFIDRSREQDQEYFCEGLADEIIVALSKLSGLRLASRTSSFACARTERDVREVGRRLGVAAVLGGTARRAGERLRVTVELVDAADGFEIWAERYEGGLEDVFAIQDEIARKVVEALRLRLSDREKDALARRPTHDIQAYDYYLQARKCFYRYSRRAMQAALSLFARAIEQDPSFARAHAGIADCCSFLYQNAGADPTHLGRADAASVRALELEADLAEAHASRGTALSLAGRHAEAEESFATALRLDPRLFEAHYFFARELFSQGRLEQAAAQYEEARRVRPEDYQSALLVAQIYDDLRRPEEAAAARRAGIAAADAHLRLDPLDVRALYMGANGLAGLGERERSLEWADRALALEGDDPMVLYNVACISAMAGAHDAALDCLERSVRAGMRYHGWLEHDSNLDGVRADPRFQALMQALSEQRAGMTQP
jgi:non-specific serine/threonine protein kinase